MNWVYIKKKKMKGQKVKKLISQKASFFTRFSNPFLSALHFLHEDTCSPNKDRLKVKRSMQVAI